MPYKRARDQKWVAQVKIDGKKITQRTFGKKQEAQKWEREMSDYYKKLLKEEPEALKQISTSLLDWANGYLEFAKIICGRDTFVEKEGTFRRFFEQIPHSTSVRDLEAGVVLKYFQRQTEKRSGNAANKDRKNLVAGWNWGTQFMSPKLPKDNPFLVPKMPEERTPRYIPPEGDFWKVYDMVEGQDKVMLATFLYTAGRRGEIFRLKVTDLNFETHQIRLWTRKRKGVFEYDELPMVEELEEKLVWWLENRPIKDTPYVFVCLDQFNFCREHYGEPFRTRQKLMERLCEKAKVEPFGFHAIRHLSASILYHQGYNQAVIQMLLRHKSPTTTNRYLKTLGLAQTREALQNGLGRRRKPVTKRVSSRSGLRPGPRSTLRRNLPN